MARATKQPKQARNAQITPGEISKDDWKAIHRFAVALEKGRFSEYVEVLQNPKKLLWKSFIVGVGKGFGAVVGATLVVALVAAILAALAGVLPDPVDNPLEQTGKKIEQTTK